jgi:cytochrome P450
MVTSALDLSLPEVDTFGLSREEVKAAYARASADHWLVRMPLGFAVVRYEDVVAILRDRRFHSALSALPAMSGVTDPDLVGRQQRSILGMEGEPHARLRRLVAPAFTPKAADRLRPFMRTVVEGLLEAVVPAGRCELVADVCEPYPIPIICELLGAPKSDW